MQNIPNPIIPLSTGCKIQKTEPSEGYHVWHCEYDIVESKRVLAWSLFLNDVEEGGELEFLYQNVKDINLEKVTFYLACILYTCT